MDAPVTAHNVDLSNCDREQVQYSGAVQPHGCLLVAEEPGLVIVQASINTTALIGIDHGRLIGAPLQDAFGTHWPTAAARLARESLDAGPVHVAALGANETPHGRAVNVFAHRASGALLIEFEIVPEGDGRPILDLYSELRGCIGGLERTHSLREFFDLAVAQIRHFTGFERVMAYKFLEDGSGQVIAEAAAPGLETYLGLHYPASDIPAPARRLFAMSWLRHLPDVDYAPVPVVPELHPRSGAPVDQSCAMLRSVSVMYSGYLKNMGVRATMVMPLLKDGRLWGLISAMNHARPLHLTYEVRMAAELLAHLLSLMMSAKEDAESYAYRLRMKVLLDRMMQKLNERADLHAGLADGNDRSGIGDYIASSGAAIVTEELTTCLGVTPPAERVRDLVRWLVNRAEPVFVTDRLGDVYPPAQAFADRAAGLLAVRLARRRPEFVMWFRPEQAQTVHWAGDPAKPVEIDPGDGGQRLRPRGSFALWKEEVRGRARPWADFEVKAAADLRWAIVEVILARAEETERLNRELQDVNLELDSFAYVASHDLKEPLRGIHHMATFLERGLGQKLDADARKQIETIVRLTRRMDDLIESLLQYSRTGRVDLVIGECNMNALLDDVLVGLKSRLEAAGTEVRRPAPLPVVRGDRVRLREVLTNLISNAIKYNDKPQRWIEIGSLPGTPPVFYVKDNGIGIEHADVERVFQIFRRLHGRDEYGGGTGAGLTIAKRTIERHGGRLWLESVPGEGTTFYFTTERSPP